MQQWPLPDLETLIATKATPSQRRSTGLRFKDVAQRRGLLSQFESGFPVDGGEFFPYQVNGGGLAALDYDLDGHCDLYAVQSGGKPNDPIGSTPNQLFRLLPEQEFSKSRLNPVPMIAVTDKAFVRATSTKTVFPICLSRTSERTFCTSIKVTELFRNPINDHGKRGRLDIDPRTR